MSPTRSHFDHNFRHVVVNRASDEDSFPYVIPADKSLDASVGIELPTRSYPVLRRGTSTESSTSTATTRCASDDDSAECEKPTDSSSDTPIILGAMIPILVALLVLVYLHRRHMKKLKQEELQDPHKSLDFGMDDMPSDGKSGKHRPANIKVPEMTVTDAEKEIRGHNHGVSMDMMNSPYLLPPEMQNSRESIQSFTTRLESTVDDPYRPVTVNYSADGASVYTAGSARHGDDSSSVTESSEINQRLLKNAQKMSQSDPISDQPSDPNFPRYPDQVYNGNQHPRGPSPAHDEPPNGPARPQMSPSPLQNRQNNPAMPPQISVNNNPMAQGPANARNQGGDPGQQRRPPPTISLAGVSNHEQQDRIVQNRASDQSDYGDAFKVTPPSPTENDVPASLQPGGNNNLDPNANAANLQRRSLGFRPLPPEDPTDNPEQRANRIRSFYKEYFDDSKPGPAYQPEQDEYEDESLDYLGEGAIFDPVTNQFIVSSAPFAEPITRRAMTPPPRAPPRFQPGPAPHGPPRHQSNLSLGGSNPGPRAFSSASGRFPPNRGAPKKKLPPPSPLHTLPTPAKLKDDDFLPIDIAPPPTMKERQNGSRPESPFQSAKIPYHRPNVPVASPLISSFDDLAVMPSPHALRKSGTFTALDFAPRPRFKGPAATADDGQSIRSNGSAMSNAQLYNIRAGAYRMSRIPKELAGTKDEIAESLKPSWDLNKK